MIEDEEIKKVAPQTAKVMEIQEFVKADAVDPIYLETSYYMAPDEAGEKPYALLFDALKKSGYMGIAKVTMHNREHVVILRPGANGVLLHTMYYNHEIRKVDEFRTDLSLVKAGGTGAGAAAWVEALAAEFEPDKYKDSYRENLLQMIESKKEGREVIATPEPRQEKVVDILEALKASLAVAKKPATSASAVKAIDEAKPAKRRARG